MCTWQHACKKTCYVDVIVGVIYLGGVGLWCNMLYLPCVHPKKEERQTKKEESKKARRKHDKFKHITLHCVSNCPPMLNSYGSSFDTILVSITRISQILILTWHGYLKIFLFWIPFSLYTTQKSSYVGKIPLVST